MLYSSAGLLALVINLIINHDVLLDRSGGKLIPALRSYRLFLLSVNLYFVTDIAWGLLYEHGLIALTYADTVFYFLFMGLSILFWTRYVIDYLRERNVRVMSATEGVDTFRGEDDLVIGIRGLMNDYYAKDIGKKIRAGYRQKQKAGIVITPPFGYWKDKNTEQIKMDADAAVTVQLRAERCGKEVQHTHKTRDGQFLWTYASAKNILVEEAYTGVLNNHRSETNDGRVKRLGEKEWYRHENFFPVIIEREEWEQVQALLKRRTRPANGNQAKHRYAGLLTCQECGNVFIPMIRYWNGSRRVEYVCKGYHRQGKELCSSHRIREECLDAQVVKYAESLRESWAKEQTDLQRLYKQWSLRQPALDREIAQLREQIRQYEEDIDELLMMRIQSAK